MAIEKTKRVLIKNKSTPDIMTVGSLEGKNLKIKDKTYAGKGRKLAGKTPLGSKSLNIRGSKNLNIRGSKKLW